jgi:hypothetical protein
VKTMDVNIFTELISNVGLPIALIVAMGVFIFMLYKDSVKREEKLTEEVAETRAINSKAIETIALYAERLTVIESDVKEIKDIVINK